MPKSVFQQLVEQTCSNANFKPSNNKAAKAAVIPTISAAADTANGHSKSVTDTARFAVGSQSPITNHKSPIERAENQRANSGRVEEANRAPRCFHVKSNGVRCKSPAMRSLPFCFFHDRFYNPPFEDSLPSLEDANSVQCAILQVLNALKRKLISPLEARVFLYGLKAASINARRTTFEPLFQRQVTEMPYMESRTAVAATQNDVVIPSPAGEGPAVVRKPPSPEVIPSEGRRGDRVEGSAFRAPARPTGNRQPVTVSS